MTTIASFGILVAWMPLFDLFALGNRVATIKCAPLRTHFSRASWNSSGKQCQIHDVAFSNAGDSFLVISGTSQPKLYNRDAQEMSVVHVWCYLCSMSDGLGHPLPAPNLPKATCTFEIYAILRELNLSALPGNNA